MKFYYSPTLLVYSSKCFLTHATFQGCNAILQSPPITLQGNFKGTFDYLIIKNWVSIHNSASIYSSQTDLDLFCLFLEDCYAPYNSEAINTLNLNQGLLEIDGFSAKNCPKLEIDGNDFASFFDCKGTIKNSNTSTSKSFEDLVHFYFGPIEHNINISYANFIGNHAAAILYHNLTTVVDTFNIINNTLKNNMIDLFSNNQIMRNGCFFGNQGAKYISAKLENCFGDLEKEGITQISSISTFRITTLARCLHSDDFTERLKSSQIVVKVWLEKFSRYYFYH